MDLKSFNNINLNAKKVLVRVDFNVPLDDMGNITDITRIKAHVSTIKELLGQGAKVALISHLGRPKGNVVPKYSLAPVAPELEKLLGNNTSVRFVSDCVGRTVTEAVENWLNNEVLLLENVRFYSEEEKNEAEFAKKLAENFDVFVMDAFSVSHRAHSSTSAITNFLPSYSGNLIDKEITMLSTIRDNPANPFVLILGGSKVSDKIAVIENMLKKVNTILIGGGMAFTFLKAQGYEIGKSLCETNEIDFAKRMLKEAEGLGVEIILPTDVLVAESFSNDVSFKAVLTSQIPINTMGLDIGPETSKIFADKINNAKSVLWNGPMGVFEMSNFSGGSRAISLALSNATKHNGTITVVGGGDSAAAITLFKLEKDVTHVSTGGGASLEFFEGKDLPGITPYII
ncbi:MAG: phosphoglycerate kinase [Synergistaceae bacterium]